MFFDVDDFFVLVQKKDINREKHSNCVHATGRDDPKTAPQLRPTFCLTKKTDEPTKVVIGHRCLGCDKSLARFVVDIELATRITARHLRLIPLPASASRKNPCASFDELLDRLTFPAPNNDAENNHRQNARDDPNQCNVIHVRLLLVV
jgi:hypothetical protein